MNTNLWFYIYTPKRLIVSTQSIYCYILAMHFCISLKGHIKIDLKNRLNWSPRSKHCLVYRILLQQNSCLCMKSYITLYENVMNYFLHTRCVPKWEKLKYLKYIRLSLQDHQWSFKHAAVYRINSITKCLIQ